MKITTQRHAQFASRYRIVIDGRPTRIVVQKGLPPKYRNPQLWDIGIERSKDGSDVDWISSDQHGKDAAVQSVLAFAEACQEFAAKA